MRGNAPCGVKGINGLRAFGAWHFCAGAKMPNVSIAVYVPPRALPWAMGNIWAYSPPHLCSQRSEIMHLYEPISVQEKPFISDGFEAQTIHLQPV